METSTEPDLGQCSTQTANAWKGQNLATKLKQPPVRPPIYTGEDGMEDEEELDLSNLVDLLKVPETELNLPVIDFTIEEC